MPDRKNERLFFLFVLAGLLLLYPIVDLASHDTLLFGLPLLYVYLFGAWLAIIIFIYIVVARSSGRNLPDDRQEED